MNIFFLLICCLAFVKGTASEPLIVGTNAEFPPFTFIEKGEIVGFDIDVVKEVAKRLKREIKLKDMPFEALIPEVTLGQIHVIAAGMSYTDERAKRMFFTSSYLTNDPLLLISLVKAVTLDELKGKTIVVNEGFVADLFLSDKTGFQLVRLATSADGFLAVKHKRAAAFLTAKSTYDSFIKSQSDQQFFTSPIEGTDQTCALVISKKYPELANEIQRVIDEMIKDGTIATLRTKWKLA